jgi:hypothetical protein
MAKMLFRRIGGRIVPILERHPVATGMGAIVGATYAATKTRQAAAQAFRGKGKKGTGSPLTNLAADFAISTGYLTLLNRHAGRAVSNGIQTAFRVIRSF